MNRDTSRSRNESQPRWESARSRTASELLAILAPTEEEPQAILESFVWKTGTPGIPAPKGAP